MPSDQHKQPRELEDDADVYRALLYPDWINPDTKQALAAAFMRRKKDRDGISVGIGAVWKLREFAGQFNPTLGIGILVVGHVRRVPLIDTDGIPLDVVPSSAKHAAITGLPYRHENLRLAEHIAGMLARQCRVITDYRESALSE